MLLKLVNGRVFGSTINKYFFFNESGRVLRRLTNKSTGFSEFTSSSTFSSVIGLDSDKVLAGNVLGQVSCYSMFTGQFLYTVNKLKDEGDPMDALIGGGGVHSLFRRGHLIFAGMQDSMLFSVLRDRNDG